MRDKCKVLILTGGLGNQLFQLAGGLASSPSQKLLLESTLGNPRLNVHGKPELDSFSFSFDLKFHTKKYNPKMTRFLVSQAFKISSKEFRFPLIQQFWLTFKSLFYFADVFLSDGVGFDARVNRGIRERWIIGPFHTYMYASEPRNIFNSMTLKNHPEWLSDLEIAAKIECPIILHIRLTDYREISELGILQSDYYERALLEARRNFPNSRIWLFTDEEHLALEILGRVDLRDFRVINYENDNASANLEAMRFGHCYVLSNSTFSWWGAFLTYSDNAQIYCPEFWFRTKPNPARLIPDTWIKVPQI